MIAPSGLLAAGSSFDIQAYLPTTNPLVCFLAGAVVVLCIGAPVLWWLIVQPLRRAARTENECFVALLKHAADGIVIFDALGTVQGFNPAAERIFNRLAEKVMGQHIHTLLTDQIEVGPTAMLGKGVCQGVCRRVDGSQVALEWTISPLPLQAGKGFVAVVRDVSERCSAEQEVREYAARQEAIVAAAGECIITLDARGQVIDLNPAVERTLGYHRDDMLGKRLAQLIFPPSMDDRKSSRVWQHFATVGGFVLGKPIEVEAMRANGTEFPAELSVTAIEAGGARYFAAFLDDISKRKRAEQRLAIGQAVSGILTEANGLAEAAPRLLETVFEHLRWDVGIIWGIDPATGVLQCLEFRARPGTQAAELEALCRQSGMGPGTDLAGNIWARGEPVWVVDFPRQTNLARASAVGRAGLHSAFGFPVMLGNEVRAVIEFFSRQTQPTDKELLRMMARIGGEIGQFIERHRTESNAPAMSTV
jgi:PAS domain S-box-containing protein